MPPTISLIFGFRETTKSPRAAKTVKPQILAESQKSARPRIPAKPLEFCPLKPRQLQIFAKPRRKHEKNSEKTGAADRSKSWLRVTFR